MPRQISIITTCMGRLEHLKLSLPTMLAQPGAEVIVVDFSCPDGTGAYVTEHFPEARVVSVPGEQSFSNWKARNAGAAAATGDLLLFCDADTLLAPDAAARIVDQVSDGQFGVFERFTGARFNTKGVVLSGNQLGGFQALPAAAFKELGGYDEVLEGYAAGGDTDLAERLRLARLELVYLDPEIVESVIEHDSEDRFKHHREDFATSYVTGLLYRAGKLAMLRISDRLNLPLKTRQHLYERARSAAEGLDRGATTISLTISFNERPVHMASALGHEDGAQRMSLKVEVALGKKIEKKA